MSDKPINQPPPEEVEGGIREPIPVHTRELAERLEEIHHTGLVQYTEHILKNDSLPTSRSRAELCLIEYRENIEKKHGWTIPCGISLGCLGILISILTSNQNEILTISKDFLKGVFSILTVFSFPWTLYSLFHYLRLPKISEKDVLNKMDIRQARDRSEP